MTLKTIQRRATLAPTTWNEATRTIDVTFTSFADVRRGGYVERVTRDGLDLSRLVGAHVLMDHDTSSIRNVLGVVLKAKRDGTATLQLSDRPDVAPFVSDIAKGVIRNLSFSAHVPKWRDSVESGERIRTAVRWQPYEVSFVAAPADHGATTRGAFPMPKKAKAGDVPANDDVDVLDTPENDNNHTVTRNQAIRALCRENRMTQAFTDNLIDGDGGVIEARAAVETELQRRAPTIRATVGVSHEDPAAIMQRQIGGAFSHITGAKPADNEREYTGLSVLQHFRDMLERRNVNTRRMNDGEVIQRAFGTGDAPEFLTGVGNRSVQAAYQEASHPIMGLTVTKTVTDYRPVSFLRDSAFDGELEEINEHGEFTQTSFDESKLTAGVTDYARGFSITEKAFRNDDLGVFTTVTAKFGAMAARKDASLVLALLAGAGPIVEDTHNLFDAVNHNNYDPSNTPLSVDSLSDGRLAMRSITGEKGEALNLAPRYLVVSKELETSAEKLLAAITPTTTADAQPIKLTLIVDGGLEPYSWYLFAEPTQAPVLAILRLAGAEAPRVEQSAAWDTYAQRFRCKHTVGATALGWRGAAKWASGEDSNSAV